MAERIAGAASAYLRQHAHQPVDWWPFGPEPFGEARRRDVPVFLSIGYAACHWCHVMAAESFDDPETASYLNAHFVPVKVDREERPDVDAVYMAATQTLTGQGGWPMSVFALPDGRAVHAGTYFPPRPVPGTPSFRQVLEAVADAWALRRPALERQAAALAEHLGGLADAQHALVASAGNPTEAPVPGRPPGLGPAPADLAETALPRASAVVPVGPDVLAAAVRALQGQEDPAGGFGPAPKFPPSAALDFLLRHAAGAGPSAEDAGGLAGRTLRAMALGALHDHVGGGFARYCVDAAWRLPHFEKMLYDNAQLLRHYARWSALAPDPGDRALARRAALGTASWLEEEMVVDGGAFASSLDADTVLPDGRHVEGGTYLFADEELARLAGPDAGALMPLLDGAAPEPGGTGRTIAFARLPDPDEWRAWDRARPALAAARAARPQPARDGKVVAAWNGLAVRALAEASVLLREPRLAALAAGAGQRIWDVHWDDAAGTLARVSYAGRAGGPGRLEDYAATVLGYQALAAATADPVWTDRARTVLEAARAGFLRGGRLRDSLDDDAVLAAARGGRAGLEPLDDVAPSGVGLFATALLAQAGLDARTDWEGGAAGLLAHAGRLAERAPQAVGTALAAAGSFLPAGPPEVAVVGGTEAERNRCVAAGFLAGAAVAAGPGSALWDGRPAGPGGALRVYVCRAQVCAAPLELPAEVERALLGRELPRG